MIDLINKWIVLPGLIISFIYFFNLLRKIPLPGLLHLYTMAYMYMFGKSVQQLMIGPWYIRWYLADIGFVPIFAFIPLFHYLTSSKVKWTFSKMLKYSRNSATIFFLVAVLQEIISLHIGTIKALRGEIPSVNAARGDYIDIVCYMVSYIAVQTILGRMAKAPVQE